VKSGDNGADQVLEVFAPDGGSHPVASKLDYHPVRVSADGLHWVEEKIVDLADGGHATAAVTHRADGSVGAPIDLPGIVDQASFPSPAGDSVIAVVGNRVRLVGAAGDRQLFDRDVYVLRQAAWDSAGTSVLLLLAPLVAGGLAGPKELWEIDLSSFTSHAIHLPPRPPVGVVASHLGEKTLPSEVMAAAWSPSGRRMALLTNHETECWRGGQDIPAGCAYAVYEASQSGTELRRLSPRAFHCRELTWLRP
jgi:hypothetical protein